MGTTSRPPKWITPQLTRLVDEAPTGDDWLHEIKYGGTATDRGGLGQVAHQAGLDWSHRYWRTVEALQRRVLT